MKRNRWSSWIACPLEQGAKQVWGDYLEVILGVNRSQTPLPLLVYRLAEKKLLWQRNDGSYLKLYTIQLRQGEYTEKIANSRSSSV